MNDCTLRSLPLSCVLSLLLSCTLITLLSSLLLQSSLTLSFYPLSPSKLSPTSPMFPLEALSLSAKVRTPSNPLFVSLSNLYTSLVCPFLIESLSLRKVKTLIVVDDSAGGAVSGGSVHVTLREEALRGTTVALEDFGEVTNGLRVEIDVQDRR